MKKIIIIFALFIGIVLSSAVFAAQPKLVVFCSSWNMKCRQAQETGSSAAQSLGIAVINLDIDKPDSQQKALDLGIDIPSSIPYFYVLDKKGKIIFQKNYNGESSQDLIKQIQVKL